MKLTTSLRGGGSASFSFSFFRRRLRSNSFRGGRASPFFTIIGRKRGGAAEHPEPSSPKVTCIGQVRVKSQKKVKQCRRRIGEASFRGANHQSMPPPPPQQRRWRDQRCVHFPNISVVLRAFGKELCCLFRCRCCCFRRREIDNREKCGCCASENGCGARLGRWLVNGCEGERRREIDVVVSSGDEVEETAEIMNVMSAGNSRMHVFDDIEVRGDRIEVKGEGLEREATRVVCISIPPKNALLLMRCRSDPIKMAAIANRISSDSARYENACVEDDETTTTSSNESFIGEHKLFVAQVLVEMHNDDNAGKEKSLVVTNNEDKVEEEIEQQQVQPIQEEEELLKSNVSNEALVGQENDESNQDEMTVEVVEAKSEADANQDSMIVQEVVDDTEEKNAVASDKLEAENDMPEKQETETALPECLLLMMREPKLSMEVSKETWVCATDFIRLLPERPRRAAASKAAAVAGGDHEPVVRRRAAVEKPSRPRVPAPPSRKNNDVVQPARSSCSLPAGSTAAVIERKRVKCQPLALTRCKSEPMSTAAAKLMPEAGCWKDNVEPHRQTALGVGAAGVGC